MNDFITIYTDASVRDRIKKTQAAWRGKCAFGVIEGIQVLKHDGHVARAEMKAILCGIHDAVFHYPQVSGLFINSDNLQCVQSFWAFKNMKPHKSLKDIYRMILNIADGRWIRAKHVKAHTGGKDVRSWMNRRVDHLTRREALDEDSGSWVVTEPVGWVQTIDEEGLFRQSDGFSFDQREQQAVGEDQEISQAPGEPIHDEVV